MKWNARGPDEGLRRLARRRDLIPEAACSEMRRELEAIAKMISGLIAGLDKRKS